MTAPPSAPVIRRPAGSQSVTQRAFAFHRNEKKFCCEALCGNTRHVISSYANMKTLRGEINLVLPTSAADVAGTEAASPVQKGRKKRTDASSEPSIGRRLWINLLKYAKAETVSKLIIRFWSITGSPKESTWGSSSCTVG